MCTSENALSFRSPMEQVLHNVDHWDILVVAFFSYEICHSFWLSAGFHQIIKHKQVVLAREDVLFKVFWCRQPFHDFVTPIRQLSNLCCFFSIKPHNVIGGGSMRKQFLSKRPITNCVFPDNGGPLTYAIKGANRQPFITSSPVCVLPIIPFHLLLLPDI